MLISIIIPVYNVEEYIEECLESVYQQTYPNIEVILVNDCTPDKSMEIAKSVSKKYKNKFPTIIIEHKQNKGISITRNSGIQHAKGEYIYFIDSDDAIIPDTIRLLANIAIKYKGIDIVEGRYFIGTKFTDINKHPITSQPIIYKNYDCKKQFLIGDVNLFIWNNLFKRTFITTHSLTFQPNIIYEDALFRIKATEHLSSMAILPTPTYFYRYNNSSLSHKASIKNLISIKIILEQLYDILTKKISLQEMYLSCFCKNAFLYWNKPCRRVNEHEEYLKSIKKMVKNIVSQYHKQMKFMDMFLLSPFYLPYNIAKYYVKIIWKILL